MEMFSALGAEMAQVAGRLGTLDPAVCSLAELEWMVASGRRIEAFSTARVALATVHLERLLREQHAETLRGRSPVDAVDGSSNAGGGPEAVGGADTSSSDAAGDGQPCGDGGADDEAAPERRESAEEYEQRLRQAKWLRRCPVFAAALQAGSITAGHVDVLAAALDNAEPHVMTEVLADEERLVEAARRMVKRGFAGYLRDVIDRVRADGGMSRFERQLRESFASFKPDDDTQMYRLFCNIDPGRGAEMFEAVQRRVDEMYQTKGATDGMTRGQVVLAALHGLVCREPAAAEPDDDDVGGGPEILIVCDCQTFTSGQHAHTVCETAEGLRLPVSFVRDMCAEAMLTVAIAGADGKILAVGMRERIATRAQRRALRATYRHCAHPDCSAPFVQCRIHHVVPWEDQGPTDLANLLPLCFKHHHLVHEGGWRLTLDEQRTQTWYRPGGALYATVPFVPLLAPAAQRSSTARGSPPGTGSRASPPNTATTPDTAAAADTPEPGDAQIAEARLFDPSAA